MWKNPLFLNSHSSAEIFYHQKMMQKLFGLAANSQLTVRDKRELIKFMSSTVPAVYFRRLIEVSNFFITQRLLVEDIGINRANVYSDWAIPFALKFLTYFMHANDIEHKVSISEFYNTGLDALNLLADFENWQLSLNCDDGSFYFCKYSFAISLASKMKILQYEANKQHEILAAQAVVQSLFLMEPLDPFLVLKIRRENILNDSLFQLSNAHTKDLKKKLKIEFENENGLDAGGLTKEWMALLVGEVYNPTASLFKIEEESQLLWFNLDENSHLKHDLYNFCGVIIGLAIYNGVILDLKFPLILYKKLLNAPTLLEDLKEFKPVTYKNLKYLLEYTSNDLEEVFSLNFEYFDQDIQKSIALMPKLDLEECRMLSVNQSNKKAYVSNLLDYILNRKIEDIFKCFKKGFMTVCSGNSLRLFQPCELDALVSGARDQEINFHLIRMNSTYSGGFTADDPFIINFWEAVDEFPEKMKRRFLHFVTGTDRLPCVGASSDFGFQIVCLGQEDTSRFPVAHTCFNQLCLVRYSSKEQLKTYLERAITECSGFDLK